jgi:hypothetical protein
MHLQDVDLPDSLLEAQESGSLVIFAGAGVSIPAPSNYPNFDRLAEAISGGALLPQENEPVDRFLGRLVKHGVHVHELARKTLSDSNSIPNSLHTNLLQLFKSASKVKIVTTNFDLHFTTAAQSTFEDFSQIEIHAAPALPLGHSFSGLVYLHGSVDKPEERLVLTDADFGRAYLTEGWARRFLQALFSAKTVLFIGYSHSDPVMNYLARGLPPQTGSPKRFALTEAENRDTWEFLGVAPIIYPTQEGDERHSAVSSVIASWAGRISMGILDQEEHIRQIVENLPASLSTENSDYILKALREASTTRFFTRYAQDPEWLRWVEKAGLLRRLFGHLGPLEPPDFELAAWFAQSFVCEHTGDALAVLQRQGQLLGEALWTEIALRLFRKKDPIPESKVFSKWVPVLLTSASLGRTRDLLDYILARLHSAENDTTAVLLFQYLTAPRIAFKKDIWGEIKRNEGEKRSDDVSVEVTAEGRDYWLTDSWQKLFRPRLDQFAEKLVPIITSHLQHAYFLLRSFDKVHDTWDPLNSHRNVIESSGSPPDFTDALIDAGRDIMNLYASKDPNKASALIEMWISCECRLLKRLAVYGVDKSAHWGSDQKIGWIVQNQLLYAPGLKHEVLQVLQSSYSGASEKSRSLLLDQVEKGPASEQEAERKAHQIYNLLHRLLKSAECALVKQRLEKIEAAHPEFKSSEHPDLDVVIRKVTDVNEQSLATADELIAKSPEEQMDFFLSYSPAYSPNGLSRDELLRTVGVAVGKSFSWGIALAQSLDFRGLGDSDLWPSIFETWNGRGLSNAEWTEILEFLQNRHFKSATYQIATLLENGIRKSEHSIPNSCLQLSFQVSEVLWSDVASSSEAHREKSEDWLFVAINHPAGILAEFWLHFISRLWNKEGEKWVAIPEENKALFAEVISGDTYASDLARVVFASHLHFFFSADKSWALGEILPLLDPANDSRRALQCWHGYVGGGRWLETILPNLLPLYEQLFPIIGNESDKMQQRFCEHLAAIACFSSINPVKHGWLKRFLQIVSPELRRKWTSEVLPMLKQLERPKKQEAWNNWLSQYWQSRIQGIPVPLDRAESGEMAEWSLHLEPVFPEVVEKITSSLAPQLERSFIYYELPETELPELYPTPVARLLLYLLRESTAPIYDYDRIDNVFEQLILGSVDRHILLDICDALAKGGYEGANRLRKLIPTAD